MVKNRHVRNRMRGGVRGRKTKVGRKLLRFPPTRFSPFSLYLIIYGILGFPNGSLGRQKMNDPHENCDYFLYSNRGYDFIELTLVRMDMHA